MACKMNRATPATNRFKQRIATKAVFCESANPSHPFMA
jgi:hypothetical protein